MTDNYSDEEFAPIAAAMKELPYFAPSPQFADKVMARVRIPGAVQAPARIEARHSAPARPSFDHDYLAVDRRSPTYAERTDLRRSVPARIAAAVLVASAGVTVATIALVTLFNIDLFLFISRVYGPSTMAFLTALSADASATATTAAASAGTAAGLGVIASFATGAVAATAALRAAASASRKAA